MQIDILHTAKLANLKLSKEEIEKFKSQLSSILDYFKELQKVDTSNTEITSQVTNLKNATREDEIAPSLSQEEVLSNTKSKHNGMFKVKGIFNE
ncbi:MAG: Asp-tRNA(Asn)/Glu-tRNA(Gln) amidotransferase subunit GatC [bacterium]|nr:Asp-tRNA(Asn)/Glu-tRNA(Gln) amidotransferase subunit GatC [bacterium]